MQGNQHEGFTSASPVRLAVARSPRSELRQLVFWLLLVGAVAAVPFVGSLSYGFHYDDFHSIVHNPHLQRLAQWRVFFCDPRSFSEDPRQAMYRPLLLWSYALNYAAGSGAPLGFRLVNVLLHAANAALVLLLVLALFPDDRGLARLTAVLFALAPVGTEAVVYISSRSDLLMAFFVLLACLAARREAETGRRRWLVAMLAGAAAALLSKSSAAVLPGLLLLCDAITYGLQRCRDRWRVYLGASLVVLVYVTFTRSLLVSAVGGPVRPLDAQLWTQCKAWVYQLLLAAVPVQLTIVHQFAVSRTPWTGVVLAAGAMLLSAGALVAVSRGGRVPAFSALWAALVMLPATAIPLVVVVSEHRLYLASMGLSLLLAWTLLRLVRRRWWMGRLCVGSYLLILLVLLEERLPVWADECTLWTDAVGKAPRALKPHLRLGDALAAAGRLREAEVAYGDALQLVPWHPGARNNLGRLLLRQGRWTEAEKAFRGLLHVDPNVIPARLNLAGLLLRRGDWKEAKIHFKRALESGDTRGVAQKNLGWIALTYENDPVGAEILFRQAMAQGLGTAEVLRLHAVALRQLGRLDEAVDACHAAIRLAPQQAEIWVNLGNAERARGHSAAAIAAYGRAVELGGEGRVAELAREQLRDLLPSVPSDR